jgi:predicted O-methyltransferase YrrM
MDILSPRVEEYMNHLTPARQDILNEMESLAAQRNFPIVGPLVGRILYQYARLLSPHRIMELGSGYGYSAFWWCVGSVQETRVYCTEGSPENIKLANDFLGRAGFSHKVEYYLGDALEALDKIPGEFDIVFMDIDKHQYPAGFEKAYPRLRRGGLFITDNVLWSGKVADPSVQDEATNGIRKYNELIYKTPGAAYTILPVRDGVAVTLKESN